MKTCARSRDFSATRAVGFRWEYLEDVEYLQVAVAVKKLSSPATGLEWPRGFQEVKVPRFHDNGTGWW